MLPNWANRAMWAGDNLEIMRDMNLESVDLIYLNPPFNSNRHYDAPRRFLCRRGKQAAGQLPLPGLSK